MAAEWEYRVSWADDDAERVNAQFFVEEWHGRTVLLVKQQRFQMTLEQVFSDVFGDDSLVLV